MNRLYLYKEKIMSSPFLLPKDNSYVLNQERSCPLKCKKKVAEDARIMV